MLSSFSNVNLSIVIIKGVMSQGYGFLGQFCASVITYYLYLNAKCSCCFCESEAPFAGLLLIKGRFEVRMGHLGYNLQETFPGEPPTEIFGFGRIVFGNPRHFSWK